MHWFTLTANVLHSHSTSWGSRSSLVTGITSQLSTFRLSDHWNVVTPIILVSSVTLFLAGLRTRQPHSTLSLFTLSWSDSLALMWHESCLSCLGSELFFPLFCCLHCLLFKRKYSRSYSPHSLLSRKSRSSLSLSLKKVFPISMPKKDKKTIHNVLPVLFYRNQSDARRLRSLVSRPNEVSSLSFLCEGQNTPLVR